MLPPAGVDGLLPAAAVKLLVTKGLVMSNQKSVHHIFGPVPSRRLGRSLGVDIVPYKTCSYDCIYCQLGKTTNKTLERKNFVSNDAVLVELKEKLQRISSADYITLSGSGEPTLHLGFGELIESIKKITQIPVAVLTNGSLLYDTDVRRACKQADLIVPSLDAGDERRFQYINRPVPGMTLEQVVNGLIEFRQEYDGQIWLEVFLLHGVNAIEMDIKKIKGLAEKIQPDRIQLNTAVRPCAEEYAYKVPPVLMNKMRDLFGPNAEIIAEFDRAEENQDFQLNERDILDLVKRRPCTIDEIEKAFSIHRNEALKYIERLSDKGLISENYTHGERYLHAG